MISIGRTLMIAGIAATVARADAERRQVHLHWRFSQVEDLQAEQDLTTVAATADGGTVAATAAAGRRRLDSSRLLRAASPDGGSGHCMQFSNPDADGNDAGVFLRVADGPQLTGHTGGGGGFESLTIFVRLRLNTLGRTQSLVRKTSQATERGYLLAVTAENRIRFAIGGWSGHTSITTPTFQLDSLRWYDIEAKWTGQHMSIRVDGEVQSPPTPHSGRLADTSAPLTFGAIDRERNSTGQFLDGWIEEIRMDGEYRLLPNKGKPMGNTADATAWGTPVRHMWFCAAHKWGEPALGIQMLKGVCHAPIFEPEYEDGAYNHHPELIWHGGRCHAMWSNNMVGEDRAGQRILYSSTPTVTNWPEPRLLFPQPGPFHGDGDGGDGAHATRGFFMTAMKFIPMGTRLFAIATFDGSKHKRITPLAREVFADGSLGAIVAIRPDYDREDEAAFPFDFARPTAAPWDALASKLLALYLTPEFLPSWNFGMEDVFPRPTMVEGPAVCEWSIHRATDGTYVMLARDLRQSHRMYAGTSPTPDPNSFSPLSPTDIPDSPSKSTSVTLPDGRVLLIGNQLAREFDQLDSPRHYVRDPLTVSISPDGYCFERQLVLRWEGGRRWRTPCARVAGRGAGCQYPSATVYRGVLYVIYSIGKEDVAISWVPLGNLDL